MMGVKTVIGRLHGHKRWVLVATVVATILSTSTAAWLSMVSERQSQSATTHSADAGWGHEAIEDLREYAAALSPIASANACGMGASSCFKCHNGARASAPKMDPKTAPWHLEHKSVNGSCVGCHKGKDRLVKKELAHEGMIIDSRLKVVEACDVCHKTGNSAELNKRYRS